MKALFVINPNAGLRIFQNGAHDLAKSLLQNGTLDRCDLFYTRKGGDAFEVTAALAPGQYDFVLAAGGDGTINEVVNGLVTSNCGIPLLLLGAGTTNDFVTALGIGRTAPALEKIVKDFCVKDVDVGVCNGHYFINVTAGGMLSDIAHSIPYEQKNQFGILAYYSVGLKELGARKFETSRLRVITPDRVFEEDVFLLVISNTCQAGGFQNICPTAKLDDGLFDVCIMKAIDPIDILPVFGMIQAGQHMNDEKHIIYFQTEWLHVDRIGGDGKFALDYDGENAGDMPLDVCMSDRKLKLLIPARSAKSKKLFSSQNSKAVKRQSV